MTFSNRLILVISALFFLVQSSITAQTPLKDAQRSTDISPAWEGCDAKLPDCTKSKLLEFISANIAIPAEAVAAGAGGVVMVEFVVEKNGKIGEVATLHDPGYGLGAEAIRVVKLMVEKKITWSPAVEAGKKVPYRYITPVTFNVTAPPKSPKAETVAVAATPAVYDVVEVMPRYAGCESNVADTIDCTFKKMLQHFEANLQYPIEAKEIKTEGPVVVEFIIDSAGHVNYPVVKTGIGHGCDEEALRVVSLMPKWIPGTQHGVPVAVRMTVPILFQLPKEKE